MGYVDTKTRTAESASKPAGLDLDFREIRTTDLDDVLAIERASFSCPWSRQFFLEELQASCAKSVLSVSNGIIVG